MMRDKLAWLVLVVSVITAVFSALAMRDHVRLVDILALFASGLGTGASIVSTVMQHRARRRVAP